MKKSINKAAAINQPGPGLNRYRFYRPMAVLAVLSAFFIMSFDALASQESEMGKIKYGDFDYLSTSSGGVHSVGLFNSYTRVNQPDLLIDVREPKRLLRLKTSRELQLTGLKVSPKVYIGPCKMGLKWRPSMVIDRDHFTYAFNDQGVSFVKKFYFH